MSNDSVSEEKRRLNHIGVDAFFAERDRLLDAYDRAKHLPRSLGLAQLLTIVRLAFRRRPRWYLSLRMDQLPGCPDRSEIR